MLFNSIEFIVFLPIVFILYWSANKNLKWQNLLVVIASYVFYCWWDIRFLFLIILTSSFCFISGILIERAEGNRKKQKVINTINILLNLGILGTFKYFNFFSANLKTALHTLGFEPDWITLDILLPVGISFYTLQALSYSIDVYQKKISACHDPVAFFAFVSFFPQLVAGPIERATNLLPQFYKRRTFDYHKAIDGCQQMLWGFFKKMIIADNCAIAVNEIWSTYQYQSGFTLLLEAFLFTFQIYGDFSGYSDIAIGCSRLFGINLMKNFNYPYFSRDISEFWRRWHISLSTWFRDYIYIPLGGSRCKKTKVIRNTFIIFIISGLWHGANWTFVAWGIYHALLFIPLLLLNKNRRYTGNIAAEGKYLPSLKEVAQILGTFLLVLIGWIIFRANDINEAFDYLSHLFSPSLFEVSFLYGKKALIYCLLLFIVEWFQRDKEHGLQINRNVKSPVIRWSIYYILIFIIILLQGTPANFIYFQF
ncbi:MBOAT family O-acyltransferase [uncultured Parabacteroides sp.]|uniref:MBOAT family O-acyltransferase n=1 Tax=uncultured Parabacteroides sp. TaxID=512312 RepID=UPI00258E860C|nr:MBOAT family O-acyltransferase [uncultured Parabacteroides sp.]